MTHPCRVLLAFVTLAALVLAPRAWHPTTIIATATSPVGPKAYYLALGDSLAYGDQPNGQYFNGYADDLYASFALSGASHLIDMGCPHEMTTTFINGGCPYASAVKYPFTGSQLSAALTLISQHPGQVSPVTLDIGTDEIRPLFNSSTCALASTQTISQALSTFDSNLNTILSQLHTALNGAGDLLIMDNYFAHQNDCPNVVPLVQQFNAGLAAAAQQNGAIVAPVFAAFGGAATPNPNLCTLTWICAPEKDIHPNNQGYALIASTLDAAAGYPPLPPSPPPGEAASGVYEGTISTVGATSSYSITPSSSGSARVGMCANTNANNYDLYVYNSSGSLLASGTSPTNCEWASLSVTAGQAYTVTTVSVSGTGDFRSSWNVNGAQVVWNVGGAISSAGGTQDATFLTLSGAPIALSSCGPAGSNFNLELISAGGSVLASSTAPSNCQALTYTPS